MPPDKAAYSLQEAMILMDLNRHDILDLIHSGELEAKKYCGKFMIRRDDIQWWLIQQQMNVDD